MAPDEPVERLQALRGEVRVLRDRLDKVEREIRDLSVEQELKTAAPQETTVKPEVVTPIAPADRGPPKPADRNIKAPPRSRTSNWADLEQLVAGQWMTWLGGLSLVLAVAFFIPWAWRNFDAPPWLRVAIIHAAGAGIVAGGAYLRRKQLTQSGDGLTGVGLFTLYAGCYAMHHHYRLGGDAGPMLAFFDGTLITAAATLLATIYNSRGVALLGALGGYLTPAIASGGPVNLPVLFGYLALLNVALLASAGLRGWSFFRPLVFVVTWIVLLGVTGGVGVSPSTRWELQTAAGVHAAILLAATSLPALAWGRRASIADLTTMSANTMAFMGYTWLLFTNQPGRRLGAVALMLAALHYVLSRSATGPLHEATLRRRHVSLAIALLTLSVPLALHQTAGYWALAWGVEALTFVAVGVWYRDRQLATAGAVVFAVALVRLFAVDFLAREVFNRSATIAGFDQRLILSWLIGAAMAVAGGSFWFVGRHKRPPARELFAWPIAETLLVVAHLVMLAGVAVQWPGATGAVIATLNALVFWLIGFRVDRRAVRGYAAFLGLGVAAPWSALVALDKPSASPLYTEHRFAMLATLAATLVAAGLLYQRRFRGNDSDNPADDEPADDDEPRRRESLIEAAVSVVGHLTLVAALSLELRDALAGGAITLPAGWPSRMVEQSAYSVLWAGYAASLAVVGIVLRSHSYRALGIVGLLAVLAKVFLADLSQLAWMPRIVALAAIGVALIGVSALYQRFAKQAADASGEPSDPPP